MCKSALRCTGLVELEQALQDLLVGKVGGPAVGGGDGGVEVAVGVVEPGGALVERLVSVRFLRMAAALASTGRMRSG